MYTSKSLLSLTLFLFGAGILLGQSQSELIREIFQEKLISNKWSADMEADNAVRGADEFKFTSSTLASEMEGEPTIAINPKNPDNIVVSFMVFSNGSLSLPIYVTMDGGQTWTLSDFSTVEHYNSDPERLDAPVAGGGDPILEFDNDGRLYFMWIYLGLEPTFNGRWHNFWAESVDGGLTFSVRPNGEDLWNYGELNLLTNQLGDEGDGVFDRNWLAVDRSGGPFDGSLYVAGLFINNNVTPLGTGGMVMKIKRPGDATWQERHISLSVTPNAQFANIKVDDEGRVHIVYGNIDDQTIVHQYSEDGGETFSSPVALGSFEWKTQGNRAIHDRENAAPSLAIGQGDLMSVAWTTTSLPAESYVVSSTNAGRSWSAPQPVTDLVDAGQYDGCIWPVIAADGTDFTMFFYALDGKSAEYAAVHSNDGGQTYGNFEVVSAGITDFGSYSINNQFSETFFGDYNNAARVNGTSYVVFSDGRAAQGPKVYLISSSSSPVGTKATIFGDDRLSISPNPSAGDWTVEWLGDVNADASLRVINSAGKVARQKQVMVSSGKNQWQGWNDLPSGQYMIQFEQSNQVVVKPLIIR